MNHQVQLDQKQAKLQLAHLCEDLTWAIPLVVSTKCKSIDHFGQKLDEIHQEKPEKDGHTIKTG